MTSTPKQRFSVEQDESGEYWLMIDNSASAGTEDVIAHIWEQADAEKIAAALNEVPSETRPLAVGEKCAGDWDYNGDAWRCRCGAKDPSECKTETAPKNKTSDKQDLHRIVFDTMTMFLFALPRKSN